MLAGLAGVFLFAAITISNLNRVPSPTATTTGIISDKYNYGKKGRESSCTVWFKVGGKEYFLPQSCGFDREGDQVEIVYSVAEPFQAYVKREKILYTFLIGGVFALISGFFIFINGRKLAADPDNDY